MTLKGQIQRKCETLHNIFSGDTYWCYQMVTIHGPLVLNKWSGSLLTGCLTAEQNGLIFVRREFACTHIYSRSF